MQCMSNEFNGARGESGSGNGLSVCENPLWGGGAAFRPRSQKAAKVPSLPPLLCREAGDTNQHCDCLRPKVPKCFWTTSRKTTFAGRLIELQLT